MPLTEKGTDTAANDTPPEMLTRNTAAPESSAAPSTRSPLSMRATETLSGSLALMVAVSDPDALTAPPPAPAVTESRVRVRVSAASGSASSVMPRERLTSPAGSASTAVRVMVKVLESELWASISAAAMPVPLSV